MSASISSTRAPPTASAIAMFTAVVVLPSSGWELATATTRARRRELPGQRRADQAIRLAEVVRHRPGQQVAIAGDDVARPRNFSLGRRVTSSGVLTVSSR